VKKNLVLIKKLTPDTYCRCGNDGIVQEVLKNGDRGRCFCRSCLDELLIANGPMVIGI
jgi:hypothetical protein